MAFKYAVVLTGSIATGKSTVSKALTSSGFHIIDADQVAHKILDVQHMAIAEMFGETLIDEGRVDRKVLGAIIFADSVKRKQLEDLLHPLIYDEIEQLSMQQDLLKKPYFIDIPLFFETERYPIKRSLVIYTPPAQQLERLMSRDGYTKEEALARIKTQIPVEEKCKRATYVMDNSGTLTQLKQECERVKEKILVGGTLNDSN